MAILEKLARLMEVFQQAAHGAPTWPPASVKSRWDKIETYRRYYNNDLGEMLQNAPLFNRSEESKSIFTPVAVTREVCQYSADLLFSAEPTVTFDDDTELLTQVQEANGLASRLVDIAAHIAVEGRGGLRIIRDSEIEDGTPLITHIHENQIIWDERHGGFVLGGAVVMTRVADAAQQEVYRLIEEHKAGVIERKLYRGKSFLLGQEVALNTLKEFAQLQNEQQTGMDKPTLVRWDNVSGGRSDIAGQEVILDRINEEFSRGTQKSRRSKPVTFAARELANQAGEVDLDGIILTGAGNMARDLGEDPAKTVETVQPDFKSAEVIAWLNFLIDSALLLMGYSKASYGRDEGGSADSGKALKLRQNRTLLKKAGKDRMASEALRMAYALALCWLARGEKVNDHRPEVLLGDGMPRDELEDAQTAQTWNTAGAISLEETIRMRRPDWDDDAVEEEAQRIRDSSAGSAPVALNTQPQSTNGAQDGL